MKRLLVAMIYILQCLRIIASNSSLLQEIYAVLRILFTLGDTLNLKKKMSFYFLGTKNNKKQY